MNQFVENVSRTFTTGGNTNVNYKLEIRWLSRCFNRIKSNKFARNIRRVDARQDAICFILFRDAHFCRKLMVKLQVKQQFSPLKLSFAVFFACFISD